ncbi:hypothetical protein FKM82_023393 [Ascaphus truei]
MAGVLYRSYRVGRGHLKPEPAKVVSIVDFPVPHTIKQKPRCVCCGENHNSKECPRDRKKEPATCANCKGPHPASYRGCPYLTKAKQEEREKRTPHLMEQAPRKTPTTQYQLPRLAPERQRTTEHLIPDLGTASTQRMQNPDGQTYAETLRTPSTNPVEAANPDPAGGTASPTNWLEIILKIASAIARMDIHPIVTMIANLIPALLRSTETNHHGSNI